jgi:ribosome modulation factor
MGENAQGVGPDLKLLQKTATVRALMERTSRAYLALLERWESFGYTQGAVERAMEALAADDDQEFVEMRGAQALLSALKAPVQLELVSLHEIRGHPDEESVQRRAYEAGFFARFEDRPRRCRSFDEAEREAWLKGWDEANALLGAGD